MEKVLFSDSKSRKVKRRQTKEEENLAIKEFDRPKNETPKAKTKNHSKLKRTKDGEHRTTAGESTRNGEVTPKFSRSRRTSKAKRSKDSDDLDLEASVVVLEETPKSITKNLPRGVSSEDGKSGDVNPTNVTPKETPPVCHTPRGSSSGSEDDGSPSLFLCTQDEYVVGWDYGSPRPSSKPDYRSKKKGRRRKYKTKLFSPLQQNRRIIPKKAVSDDMSEAIRVFQEATKKIKKHELNAEGSIDEPGAGNSSCDSYGSTSVINSEQEKDEVLMLEEETVSNVKPLNNSEVSNLKSSFEIDGEDLIILLDDDDDECMVQCSQQVENTLKAVSANDEFGCADHKLNLPDLILCEKPIKQKQENPFEENGKTIVKSSTNSLTGSLGISEIRAESFSTIKVNKKPANITTSNRKSDCYTESIGNFKTETSISKIEPVFDDSFDAILETFTDEDIELLSQGLEDKGNKSSKVQVPGENSCNGQKKIISDSSGAQRFMPKESSSFNKDKKLLQSNGLANSRMPFTDKNSTIPSKMLPGANLMGILTKSKSCYNPKPQMQIYANRKEKPLAKNAPQQSHLTILDTICDSSDVTSSSTQRCTPAEIERKRLEAMQRLENKRKARALFGCTNAVQLPKGPNR